MRVAAGSQACSSWKFVRLVGGAAWLLLTKHTNRMRPDQNRKDIMAIKSYLLTRTRLKDPMTCTMCDGQSMLAGCNWRLKFEQEFLDGGCNVTVIAITPKPFRALVIVLHYKHHMPWPSVISSSPATGCCCCCCSSSALPSPSLSATNNSFFVEL